MALKHRSDDGVWRKCEAEEGKCKFAQGPDGDARHVDVNLSDEEAEAVYRKNTGKGDGDVKLTRKRTPKKVMSDWDRQVNENTHDMYLQNVGDWQTIAENNEAEVKRLAGMDDMEFEYNRAKELLRDSIEKRDANIAKAEEVTAKLVAGGVKQPKVSVVALREHKKKRDSVLRRIDALEKEADEYKESKDFGRLQWARIELGKEYAKHSDLVENGKVYEQAITLENAQAPMEDVPYHGADWIRNKAAESNKAWERNSRAGIKAAGDLERMKKANFGTPEERAEQVKALEHRLDVISSQMDRQPVDDYARTLGYERAAALELEDERRNNDRLREVQLVSGRHYEKMQSRYGYENPDAVQAYRRVEMDNELLQASNDRVKHYEEIMAAKEYDDTSQGSLEHTLEKNKVMLERLVTQQPRREDANAHAAFIVQLRSDNERIQKILGAS